MKKKEENPFRNISCDEVKKNLPDYVSGKLASRDIGLNARIKKHLLNNIILTKCDCAKNFTGLKRRL